MKYMNIVYSFMIIRSIKLSNKYIKLCKPRQYHLPTRKTSPRWWAVLIVTCRTFIKIHLKLIHIYWIRDSVVGTVTRYGLNGPGFESRYEQDICSFLKLSRPVLEPTQPPIQWMPVFLAGRKRYGREADRSPPSRAEVKNEWSYTPTPPVCLHGFDRDNFKFNNTCNMTVFIYM
jgi:hypothetical protein